MEILVPGHFSDVDIRKKFWLSVCATRYYFYLFLCGYASEEFFVVSVAVFLVFVYRMWCL